MQHSMMNCRCMFIIYHAYKNLTNHIGVIMYKAETTPHGELANRILQLQQTIAALATEVDDIIRAKTQFASQLQNATITPAQVSAIFGIFNVTLPFKTNHYTQITHQAKSDIVTCPQRIKQMIQEVLKFDCDLVLLMDNVKEGLTHHKELSEPLQQLTGFRDQLHNLTDCLTRSQKKLENYLRQHAKSTNFGYDSPLLANIILDSNHSNYGTFSK